MVKMQKKNPIMSWSIQAQLEWRKINQVTDRLKQNTPNTTPKYKLSIIQISATGVPWNAPKACEEEFIHAMAFFTETLQNWKVLILVPVLF